MVLFEATLVSMQGTERPKWRASTPKAGPKWLMQIIDGIMSALWAWHHDRRVAHPLQKKAGIPALAPSSVRARARASSGRLTMRPMLLLREHPDLSELVQEFKLSSALQNTPRRLGSTVLSFMVNRILICDALLILTILRVCRCQ